MSFHINLISESLKRIDKRYIAYIMANTKIEKNLFAQIGYAMNELLKTTKKNFYAAIEYKRMDFVIVEKIDKEEDRIDCIIEGKCYYTWDTADRHWENKWFGEPKKGKYPKNFRECKTDIDKLKKLSTQEKTKEANKFFILFLEHFNNRIRSNFPYSEYHNDVMDDYGEDPEKLIGQSQRFVDTLFPKLGLKLIHYQVIPELAQYSSIRS